MIAVYLSFYSMPTSAENPAEEGIFIEAVSERIWTIWRRAGGHNIQLFLLFEEMLGIP